MKTVLAVLLIFATHCSSALSNTTREEQKTIAQWTAKSICKMGADEFYSIDEDKLAGLFEDQTTMMYNDIPIQTSESERRRITSQMTGYILSVCPEQIEIYQSR